MKSKRTILLAALVAFAYIASTALLWPYRDFLLRGAGSPAPNPLVELSNIPAQAPLLLITEPDAGLAPVTDAVANARTSIDLVAYELEDPQLEQELADAHNHGVAVRVVLDNLSSFGTRPNQAAYDFLKASGVAVEWAPSYFALTHQKTLVVDGSEAFIMTFNLTSKYYATSRDFAVVDADARDTAAIEAAFNSDWSGSQSTAANGDDLVWSPGSAGTLLALINTASSSLDVYNEEMADPRIIAALEAAAARGVVVRVDMTYDTNWKAAFNQLTQAGVNVRTYASSAAFYIHAKVVVADDSKAFVGSENFSSQSMDSNRELGILLSRPDIIASLEATFTKDWSTARPYSVKN